MTKKKNYNDWSKEDLIEEVDTLRKQKTYGLVWEKDKTKEVFDYYINWDGVKTKEVFPEAQHKFPVLKEVSGKEILTDKNSDFNLLIEGDNYHSLAVLNFTHNKAIDFIYIDPPYNTGKTNEWKYNDQWVDKEDSYRHSKWLSFMEKRLKLAKNLLKNSGVIFISIDDNEIAQLKILCDEIFGEDGFVGSLVWEKKKKGSHLDLALTNIKEYILVYCRSKNEFPGLIGEVNFENETYPCINPGNTVSKRIIRKGVQTNFKEKNYVLNAGKVISVGNMKLRLITDLVIKDGKLDKEVEIEAEWRYSQKLLDEFAKDGTLYFTNVLYLRRIVKEARYKKLKDILHRTPEDYVLDLKSELIKLYQQKEIDYQKIEEIKKEIDVLESKQINLNNLYADGWGSNEDGDEELRDIFGKKVFDNPKPIKLIQKLIASYSKKDISVLDFFAGSGTTAHAVLSLNKIDNGSRNFILCTNNEGAICTDICYPRVDKAINGYLGQNTKTKYQKLGGNLKYFKTDFVDSTPIDKNKKKIVDKSTEMICIKENAFESIKNSGNDYKIFRNHAINLGIIFNSDAIDEFVKAAKKIDGKFHVYVFSLDDTVPEREFKELKGRVTLCAIPEAILQVYRKVFKE